MTTTARSSATPRGTRGMARPHYPSPIVISRRDFLILSASLVPAARTFCPAARSGRDRSDADPHRRGPGICASRPSRSPPRRALAAPAACTTTSEGDYWWPDPANADGPYIQRDGMTNPDNFVGHRRALMRLSLHVPHWSRPGQSRVTAVTRTTPSTIKRLVHRRENSDEPAPHVRAGDQGARHGRGIGIIDTIHLVEVVRATTALEGAA